MSDKPSIITEALTEPSVTTVIPSVSEATAKSTSDATTQLSVHLEISQLEALYKVIKSDIISAISSIPKPPEVFWLQNYQVLAGGICALVAASMALFGVYRTAANQRQIEKDKYDRAQQEKKSVWEKKKRFLILDIINAVTDAEKYADYAASYIVNFGDGEDPPAEYYIYNENLKDEEYSDYYFDRIDEALAKISIHKSIFPIKEDEIQYLSDQELNEISKIEFKVKYIVSNLASAKRACHKFINTWTPIENLEDPTVQNDAHGLLKHDMKRLQKDVKDLNKFSLDLAKILAPEVGKKIEDAKARAEQEEKKRRDEE